MPIQPGIFSADILRFFTLYNSHHTMSSSSCRSSFLCSPRFRFQECHVEHRFHSSGSQPVCTHLPIHTNHSLRPQTRNHHAYFYASPFYPIVQLMLATPCYGRQRTHYPEASMCQALAAQNQVTSAIAVMSSRTFQEASQEW